MLAVIIYLMLIGVILYLIETYIPMAAPIKLVIRIVVVVCLVLWLMQLFGISGPPMPRLR